MAFDPKSLIEILDRSRDRFIEAGHTIGDDVGNPQRRDLGDDVSQYVDGFLSLLKESAGGEGSSIRDFYLSTAIPPLLSSGALTPEELIRAVVGWGIVTTSILMPLVPEAGRDQAHRWLLRFFADYVADIALVCYPPPADP